MRKHLPFLSLLAGTFALSTLASAQQTDRFAYAVTDQQAPGGNWSFLRKINLQTGEYSPILLSGNDASLLAYNAETRKQFEAPLQDVRFGNAVNAAFATGVAALAYDKKNDRLWYTPMFIDQLRYVDLRTMQVYYYTGQGFSGAVEKAADQSNIITRMTIGDDGYGYALTNDGNQLVRFSTNRKAFSIEKLGALVDDPANKQASVHNSCSSFGGDMVADDDGNLYVFSARNNVFRVNINSRVATHLGAIQGVPATFSVNGAAVTEENKVLVVSAMAATSGYLVDLRSMSATPYAIKGVIWQTSDLANGNVLVSGNKPKSTTIDLVSRNTPANSGEGKISIYPNPVTNNQFAIQFTDLAAGNYTLQVTDVMGRQVVQQNISLGSDNQTQVIRLDPGAARGVYLVKVTDQSNRAVYSNKLVLQ